jgi:hypothetical protein
VKRKRRGNVFKCQNPDCGKTSCLSCNRESRPFHKCYEREQDSLRLFVEKAMADAVKRTVSIREVCNLYIFLSAQEIDFPFSRILVPKMSYIIHKS